MKNKYLKVIILAFILACILVVPSIIKGNGVMSIDADFDYQQIPFGIATNDLIKEGQTSFNWNNDIGTDFIGSFSFYNLGTISFILSLIFKGSVFPYLIGPMYIIKIVLSALFAYMFIERYLKNKDYAVIGALLYAFSGYHITSLLFHFQDMYYLFPLLLYCLDKTMLDNKRGWFLLAVTLNSFANYFMFIGEVVFLILYFIVKLITKEYKLTKQKFIILAIESLLGVGISAVLLIPSLLFVISNPRVDGTWTLFNAILPKTYQLKEILRGLILPPEIMNSRSMFSEYLFTSSELYLPFVGMILYASYIWKKPKNWMSVLIFVSAIFMVIPILNSTFYAFTTTYYARWFYMPILIMALTSAKALEEKIELSNGYIMSGLIALALFFGALAYSYKQPVIIHERYLFVNVIIALFGYVGLAFIYKFKEKKKLFINLLLLGVIISSSANITVYFYKYDKMSKKSLFTEKYIQNDLKFDYLKDGERTDSNNCIEYNLSYVLNIPNIKNFNTNIGGKNFEFYKLVEIDRDVTTIIGEDNQKLRDFLSVKYHIVNKTEIYNHKIVEQNKYYNVHENPNYLAMGIPYKYYISKEKYEKLDKETKHNILSYAVVLTREQIDKYQDLLTEINLNNLDRYNANYEIHIDELNNQLERKFKYTKKGANINLTSTKDTFIVLTIPNEKGWNVTLNGKDIEVEEVYGGLMGVKISEGENNLKLEYTTPGLTVSIIISVLSLLSTIAYIIIVKIKKI